MWTALVVLVFGFQCLHRVHLQQDVCDIADDNSAADACAMKKATGGSVAFQQLFPSFAPKGALYVRYGNVVVGGAQQLAPNRVFSQPSLSLSFINGFNSTVGVQLLQRKMALAFVDYNPQSRAVELNWLQTGFTADEKSGELTSSSSPIVPYNSPNPALGTGTHEYVFLVMREEGGLSGALGGQNVNSGELPLVGSGLKSFLSSNMIRDHLFAASFFKSAYDGKLIAGQVPSALARKQAKVAAAPALTGNRTLNASAAPSVTQQTVKSNASEEVAEQPSAEAIRAVDNSTSHATTFYLSRSTALYLALITFIIV